MSKRSKNKSSDDNEFAAALRKWEQDHPESAFPSDKTKSSSPSAAVNSDLAEALAREGFVAKSKRKTKREAKKHNTDPSTNNTKQHTQQNANKRDNATSRTSGAQHPSPGRREMTSSELMREAFDAIGTSGYDSASKYLGEGYGAAKDVDLVDERALVVDLPASADGSGGEPTNEDLLFLEEMQRAEVDRFNQSVERLRTRMADTSLQWHSEEELTVRSNEELMEPQLTGAQRDCLKRARRAGATPTINVRMLRRAEAIGEVESFVQRARAEGTRFVRIITGKGKQSQDGVPVLKPAVIEWVEKGRGDILCRAWAPETDRSGNYGAIILELAPK